MSNYNEMQAIASKNGLGQIDWVEKIALNTGRPLEVGYVFENGTRHLFCKRSFNQQNFRLCNEYEKLSPENG